MVIILVFLFVNIIYTITFKGEKKIDFTKLQKLVFEEYKKNGYSERWSSEYLIQHPEELELIIDLAEIGLFVTEVAELMEEIRDGNLILAPEEGSDIIIRVMNFFNRKGIDLEPSILHKHEVNMVRGKLHGRKV